MGTQAIIAVYNLASLSEIQDGERWYAFANTFAESLADQYNVSRLKVYGVIASLSPRNRWERNMIDAESMVKVYSAGGTYEDLIALKVCTFSANKIKAARILTLKCASDTEVKAILSGPKMIEFYHCIQELDDLCIDGHAYSIWLGDRVTLANVPSIGKKLRQTIKADYHEAAKILGLNPYIVQAITWVTWKRIHGV
jgi:hypothetical protein